MITFKKLLEKAKSEKIAVHTHTKEQVKILLEALDKKGYEWASGNKLTATTYYEVYKENTCYDFGLDELDKKVWYGSCSYCQEHDYAIVEFTDIDFKVKI